MNYRYGLGCGNGLYGNVWFMLIPTIFIGILIYMIFRTINNQNINKKDFALEELNRKLVNGEISDLDYIERRETLKRK